MRRFVVTTLTRHEVDAQSLYGWLYCARGEMENRIMKQQLALSAGRTSSPRMRANQLRLYFAAFAYVLLCALRRLGLRGTDMARVRCGTIRLRLLKIGARITLGVRQLWLSLSEGYPDAELFKQVLRNLEGIPLFEAPGYGRRPMLHPALRA